MIRKLAFLISLAAISLSAQSVDEIIAKHIEARRRRGQDGRHQESMRIDGRIKFGTAGVFAHCGVGFPASVELPRGVFRQRQQAAARI